MLMVDLNFNGGVLYVNAEQIEYILDSTGDAVLFFSSWNKLRVQNPPGQVLDRIENARDAG